MPKADHPEEIFVAQQRLQIALALAVSLQFLKLKEIIEKHNQPSYNYSPRDSKNFDTE